MTFSDAPPKGFAPLPEPPYYAVIFTNQRGSGDQGYDNMADKMVDLATARNGFLGVETTRDVDGFGITVSYWRDEEAIAGWKAEVTHLLAQKLGKEKWYQHYNLRVAKVERAYSGPDGR